MKGRRRLLIPLAAALAATALAFPAMTVFGEGGGDEPEHNLSLAAVGTGFTYQGRLLDGGSPATGVYDVRFTLWDAGAAGTQQGATLTFDDLNVSSGLFTVLLDFGAGVFTGSPRYLQMEVKPGASGAFTPLSPRQFLAPVPYAIYADTAGSGGGGGALKFGASVSGANPSTGLEVQHTSATGGNGIIGRNTGTAGVAVGGYTTGNGAGVEGHSSTAGGVGGHFINTTAGGTALQTVGGGATTTALDINNGAIKVSGTVKAAFVHTATAASITAALCQWCTVISNALTDGDPNAILIVTPVYENGIYVEDPIGVYYAAGTWRIFLQSHSVGSPMPTNAKFNVLVIKQ
jgi:hypothetical protein